MTPKHRPARCNVTCLHVFIPKVVLHLAEVKVLPGASAVNGEDVQTRCLEVGGCVVRLGDEDLVLHAVVQWLVDGRHCDKPMGSKQQHIIYNNHNHATSL